MANRESWGAVLFLAALLAGAVFLFSGLYAPGPERAGVLLPQRSAAYVTRLSRDLGRSAPGISGQAEAVKPTPLLDAVQEKIAAAEPAANSLLDRNHLFIQLYGAAQRLTQRQVVDDADPPRRRTPPPTVRPWPGCGTSLASGTSPCSTSRPPARWRRRTTACPWG